jgi:hypothetical protein
MVHETPAIGFSKATSLMLQGCTTLTGLFHLHQFQELSFQKLMQSKMFDFAISLYIDGINI